MLETGDFLHFKVSTLRARAGTRASPSSPAWSTGSTPCSRRQDNENIYLMYSDMPLFWYSKELICPTYPWEFVQLGNCGSPIETEAGWLVLTHGVGPCASTPWAPSCSTAMTPPGDRATGEPLLEPTPTSARVCAERRL